ncbi:predicted protein [Nematostella vectensis]|uniref:28S ribosomal protein S28, mitochondrial n=1 Tax=Nematostella vectensis TaxID=45351 RepID=A7RQ96_NEMVE|nr:predicted protein [Nematostella vectensis]|eukprot:XP_001638384.1 predicted protein [Nematostella vectensis]
MAAATLGRISLDRVFSAVKRPILGRLYNAKANDVENFDELLRNSQFVKLGRPAGKRLKGRVMHVVARDKAQDVYADFGWKFHAVETHPLHKNFNVGDDVEVTLKTLEATGHFLGQSKRITLCEAEAKLTPLKKDSKVQEKTPK